MINILSYISDQLASIHVPYEFGEWTQAVEYPYFVGDFNENVQRYEDGYTGGVFTLDGWCRGSGSRLKLTEISDKVKEVFDDNRAVIDGSAFFISYGSSMMVPTGEEDLYRITITLDTKEWEGE